jgi:hypothetical protein
VQRIVQAIAVAVVVVVGVSGGAAASAATPAKPRPVTVSLHVVPAPAVHPSVQGKPFVPVGDGLTVTGRAAYGSTGNVGRVDLYFRSYNSNDPALVQVATLTTAANGDFQTRLLAHATGWYEAYYRGNAARESGYAADAIFVWKDVTYTEAIYAHMDTCPASAVAPCRFASPELTVRAGQLQYVEQQSCPGMPHGSPYPKTPSGRWPTLTLAITFTNSVVEPTFDPHHQTGWLAVFDGTDQKGTTQLTPTVTTGHFVIQNPHANCSYSLVVLHSHTVTEQD